MTVVIDKRQRLLSAAKELLHEQGYHRTTLAKVAERSGVPVGNVYYYFKTKDDLAAAVVDERIEALILQREEWDRLDDPKQRLGAWLDLVLEMVETLVAYGCPVGGLCHELGRERGQQNSALAGKADDILQGQLQWLSRQFVELGQADPQGMALEFISRLNGSTLVAHTLLDPRVLVGQVARIRHWVMVL